MAGQISHFWIKQTRLRGMNKKQATVAPATKITFLGIMGTYSTLVC